MMNITGHWQKVKKEYKKDKRRKALRAAFLILPAVAFVCITFVSAIAFFLFKSVDNSVVPDTLPNTTVAISSWSGDGTPDDAVYAALFKDSRPGYW